MYEEAGVEDGKTDIVTTRFFFCGSCGAAGGKSRMTTRHARPLLDWTYSSCCVFEAAERLERMANGSGLDFADAELLEDRRRTDGN